MFLVLMVVGIVGLAVMAIPALGRHGHLGGHGHGGHLLGHGGHAGHGGGHAGHGGGSAHAARGGGRGDELALAKGGITRFLPSPRAVFSVLALYGAFGNALVRAAHWPTVIAAVVAALPALAVERFVVLPLWSLLFRFQGEPSSPLDRLMFEEARAVTPFRNGRGIVSIVRDGRTVQLAASLMKGQEALPVRVGDRLWVEDVDAQKERLTVSVPRE